MDFGMDVRIETLESSEIIYTVTLGPYTVSAPRAWNQLFNALDGSEDIQPTKMIGFGMDSPCTTPEPLIRYVAGFEYVGEGKIDPDGSLHKMKLEGGKYAIYTMRGAYKNMAKVFAKLMSEWVPDSEYSLDFARPFLEIYLNDPSKVEEKDYLTDLHLPIK